MLKETVSVKKDEFLPEKWIERWESENTGWHTGDVNP